MDWTAVATFVLAALTAGLGIATFKLASETAKSVKAAERESKATEDLAGLSAAALTSSQRPILVPVVERAIADRTFHALDGSRIEDIQIGPEAKCWQVPGERGDLWAVVPVRNIGPGPALLPETGAASLVARLYGDITAEGQPTSRVVGSGDIIDLVFHAPFGEAGSTEAAGVHAARVDLVYTDLAGTTTLRSTFMYRLLRKPILSDAVVEVAVVNVEVGDDGRER